MAKKAIITAEQLAILNESYSVETQNTRQSFPRFGMLAKDIVEETGTGKNKKIKLVQAAGSFYTEKETDEVETDDDGKAKKSWKKDFFDTETVQATIIYRRKQLRFYDAGLEKFISSPIYDNSDQVVPLYLDKRQIAKGTPVELQALYPTKTAKGKDSSKLKETYILYILIDGVTYQWNLTESSKWAFLDYARTVNPSTVVTEIGSVEETFGTNTFRKATFTSKGLIDTEVFDTVVEGQNTIKQLVESDKRFYLSAPTVTDDAIDAEDEADKAFGKI
jgi:hypothetical protein